MEYGTKILIVDDEPINLEFFDVMLSKLGFEVIQASDGEEALDKVKSDHPDLIMLDNIMPKLSGWKVTRILKTQEEYAEFADVPIIMFSAMDDVRDKIEGFELGIEDYIIKPFNFSEVLARIRAVLRHRTLAKTMVGKERRLARIESLNKSLIYFTSHLEKPVKALLESTTDIDSSDKAGVENFVQNVKEEATEVLATLQGLKDEIEELKAHEDEEISGESLLKDLELKFQKHFASIKGEGR
jgi:DNA-binding response OmpR family regulator